MPGCFVLRRSGQQLLKPRKAHPRLTALGRRHDAGNGQFRVKLCHGHQLHYQVDESYKREIAQLADWSTPFMLTWG